ncbi:Phosphoenolpyruvate carboxykinase (ATP) [bioreactor metagenome]|uniref:phosphoenolpyruvate carboxykinase (ATP) n=1 Tax=bioreactor metagenome TaxID=1076179 RepID=A0A644ZC95_9ZZZZ
MPENIIDLSYLGIHNHGEIYHNCSPVELVEHALERGEGVLTNTGALAVETGKYTGRSPKDKFIVDIPEVHDEICWGSVNVPMDESKYDRIYKRLTAYLQNRELFVFDGYAGADEKFSLPIRVINEHAWQNLFAHQLFIRPNDIELKNHKAQFTIIAAPGFHAVPEIDATKSEAFIIVHFGKKQVIIGGTEYAGEIKKSVFSVMNYLLTEKQVCPMHCSANVGPDGDVALFFGLSGTGKTTLSADPGRNLIGDDEHGWSPNGIFNFEGGCYAKCINLKKEHEPQIFNAIKFGSVLENVVIDPLTREADYADDCLTENTRAAYPIDYIPGAVIPSVGKHPKTIFLLTADAFGVMPPIARLNKEQAMYYFLSGYTSKLAGTERGIVKPEATFSSCFGAPFLPRSPHVYAKLLGELIDIHQTKVYLLNTGWTGGAYGEGNRISLRYTRAMVTAALNGTLDDVPYKANHIFRVNVPTQCPGVPDVILEPRDTWKDKEAYDRQAWELVHMFEQNYSTLNVPNYTSRYYVHMPVGIENGSYCEEKE